MDRDRDNNNGNNNNNIFSSREKEKERNGMRKLFLSRRADLANGARLKLLGYTWEGLVAIGESNLRSS